MRSSILMLILGVVLAAGPAAADDPKKADEAKKAVTVTEKDSGRKVTVPEGGVLLVQLPGHGSNGYMWELAKHDPKQLEPIVKKPATVPDTTKGEKPGEKVGETLYAVWQFKVLRPGELEMHYVRQKGDKPAKTFRVEVDVQPGK